MFLLLACSACEDNGTDVLEIEIPEGYALSAGTSTNFLNSSLAYELCRPVYTISEWYAEDIQPEDLFFTVRIPLRHVGYQQQVSGGDL